MRWSAAAVVAWCAVTPAWAGVVSLKAADGQPVAADESGTGARGVVLVPGAGHARAEWADLAASLVKAGFHVLTVDVRQAPADGTWQGAVDDVRGAVTWLKGRGATQIAVVGVDVGGAVALQAAAVEPAVTSVGVLSPKLSVPGVKMTDALAGLGARPLLVIVGSTDTTGVRAGTAMTTEPGRRLRVVEGGSTGLQLFRQAADLQGGLVGWLTDAAAGESGPRTDALRAGDASSLETTGTRIGEKP
jgi:alpha/beta superfamily hydrolase